MTYEMDIAGLKRELPLCRVTDDLYIGAFVMFGDVELTVHCAAELLKRASRRPSGLRKTRNLRNSLAHRTTWLRSDLSFSLRCRERLPSLRRSPAGSGR